MALSMYQSSIPVLIHNLSNLSAFLDKAAQHASDHEIDPAVLVNARLFPNMLPLKVQVIIACDISKGVPKRLGDIEVPQFEDTENSFEELQTRISQTLEVLRAATPEQIDGSEDKSVTIKAGAAELTFTGTTYLQRFVMPNVYFHTTTAYNILRHNGVPLGKMDFLGGA